MTVADDMERRTLCLLSVVVCLNGVCCARRGQNAVDTTAADFAPLKVDHEATDARQQTFYADYNVTYVRRQMFACSGVWRPLLVVLVHSAPDHRAQRDAIRDTWGLRRKQYDAGVQVRLVFVLGISTDPAVMRGPLHESDVYRDVLVGSFIDNYRNLTLKSLFGLGWVRRYCPVASYVLKTDDDTYFNLQALIELLPGIADGRQQGGLLGSLNVDAPVQRHGLWAVSSSVYAPHTYPPYCSGCAYVLGSRDVPSLLRAAERRPLLPMEDVYVTGILAKTVGLTCGHQPRFPFWYTGPSRQNVCLFREGRLIGIHNVAYLTMYAIYSNRTAVLDQC